MIHRGTDVRSAIAAITPEIIGSAQLDACDTLLLRNDHTDVTDLHHLQAKRVDQAARAVYGAA